MPTAEEFAQYLLRQKSGTKKIEMPQTQDTSLLMPKLTPEFVQGYWQKRDIEQQQAEAERISAEQLDREQKANKYGNWAFRAPIRGVYQTGAAVGGLTAMAGQLLKSEPIKEAGMGLYRAASEKAAEIPGIQFSELSPTRPLQAGQWVLEKALENAPFMIGTIGTAAIGKVAGQKIASRMITKVAMETFEQQAKNALIKQGVKQITPELVNITAQGIAKNLITKHAATRLGTKAGIIAGTAAMEAGGDYADIVERGLGSDAAVLKTLGSGLVKGYIETLGGDVRIIDRVLGQNTGGVARRTLLRMSQSAKKGVPFKPEDMHIVRRIWNEARKVAIEEGAEETLQESVALINLNWNDPQFKLFSAENLPRLVESGLAGASVGLVMGAGSGAFTSPEEYARRLNEEAGFTEEKPPPSPPSGGAGAITPAAKPKIVGEEEKVARDIIMSDLAAQRDALKPFKKGMKKEEAELLINEFNLTFKPDTPIETVDDAIKLRTAKAKEHLAWNKTNWQEDATLLGSAIIGAKKIQDRLAEAQQETAQKPPETPVEAVSPAETIPTPIMPETQNLGVPTTPETAPVEPVPTEAPIIPETKPEEIIPQLLKKEVPSETGKVRKAKTEKVKPPTGKPSIIPGAIKVYGANWNVLRYPDGRMELRATRKNAEGKTARMPYSEQEYTDYLNAREKRSAAAKGQTQKFTYIPENKFSAAEPALGYIGMYKLGKNEVGKPWPELAHILEGIKIFGKGLGFRSPVTAKTLINKDRLVEQAGFTDHNEFLRAVERGVYKLNATQGKTQAEIEAEQKERDQYGGYTKAENTEMEQEERDRLTEKYKDQFDRDELVNRIIRGEENEEDADKAIRMVKEEEEPTVPEEGKIVPETAPIPPRPGDEYTTAMTDLTDHSTGETIPAGTPHYVVADKDEAGNERRRYFSEDSYAKFVKVDEQEGMFAPGEVKETPVEKKPKAPIQPKPPVGEETQQSMIDEMTGQKKIGEERDLSEYYKNVKQKDYHEGLPKTIGNTDTHQPYISQSTEKPVDGWFVFAKSGKTYETIPEAWRYTSKELLDSFYAQKDSRGKFITDYGIGLVAPYEQLKRYNQGEARDFFDKEKIKTEEDILLAHHKTAVRRAIRENMPIPENVLKEYYNEETKYSAGTVSMRDSGITMSQVKSLYPKAQVSRYADGSYAVSQNGRTLVINSVETISPDKAQFKVQYGRQFKTGEENIRGSYKSGVITVTKSGDMWTLAHEDWHYLKDLGVINGAEDNAVKIAAKKDPTIDHSMSAEEQQATWIESQRRKRAEEREKGLAGRAVQKVMDWIDALVNLFHQTARGAVRAVEKGKIMGRRGATAVGEGGKYQVEAWHGSPYEFGKFTAGKIGTGEGVQSFGWGLYFTDLKDIAKHYAENLSRITLDDFKEPSELAKAINVPNKFAIMVHNTARMKLSKKEYKGTRSLYYDVREDIIDSRMLYEAHPVKAKQMAKELGFNNAQELIDALKRVENDVPVDVLTKPNRKLYKVTLHKGKDPSEYNYLEWGKPVSIEQTKKLSEQWKKEGLSNSILGMAGASGKDVYEFITNAMSKYGYGNPQQEASLFLLRAGIDGIKYKAGTLSGVESDAYNYVVFDENAVTIEDVERYSVGPTQTARQTTAQRVYDEAVAKKKPIKARIYNIGHHSDESWFARYLTPFSTRLERINPQIKAAFRLFRHVMLQHITKDTEAVKAFMVATTKMSRDDQIIFDLARKNADPGMLQRMILKYGISKEYAAFRKVMDAIYDRLIEVGYDVDYREHLHPRIISDPSGFLAHLYNTDAWGEITEAIKEAQAKQKNIPLTDEQKAHIANLVIRGYGGRRINLSTPGNAMERKVKLIDAELNQFYHDSNTALLIYITNMNKAIEGRAFFGMRTPVEGAGKQYRKTMQKVMERQRTEWQDEVKAMKVEFDKFKETLTGKTQEERDAAIAERIKTDRASMKAFGKKQEKDFDQAKKDTRKRLKIIESEIKEQGIESAVNASIGDYVTKLNLDPKQENELTRLFRDFFNYRASTGAIDIFKNLGYATAMGNFSSAITQIGDLAFAMYNAGIFETTRALGKAVQSKSRITKKDLALEQIAEEFSNPTKLSMALNKLFKFTGFSGMDRIGKEVLVNATIEKYEKMAQSNEAGLRKILEKMIPANLVEETIADFKAKEVTDNVKLVGFNTITNFQPTDVGEMPIGYIVNPGGRVFYMMKTYYIKQLDALRRESVDMIRGGNVKEGLGNFIRLAGYLMLMNAAADEIKDFMFRRDNKLSDNVIDNFLRLFGVSRYATWRLRDQGVKGFLMAIFAPPLTIVEAPFKDAFGYLDLYKKNKEIKEGDRKGKPEDYNVWNMEIWKSLPFAGQNLYWWLGGGHEKVMNRRLSNPLRKSKEKILTPEEQKDFFEELKAAKEVGHITPQEARSKRGQFFRNQAALRAKKLREQQRK